MIERRWTYADYLRWPDDERWELIEGVAYAMSPAPTRTHQRLSMELSAQIHARVSGSNCEVYAAPFDVRLAPREASDEEITTVVQPDLSIYCDASILDERGAKGSPTLVIEILSPSNSPHDTILKRRLYETNGVPEYWIVDPPNDRIYVFVLKEGRYLEGEPYDRDRTLRASAVPAIEIDLARLFPERPPVPHP
ncbi:Uma2 family endonuclease [Endothiovibrio diazotrophicus]